MSTNAMGNHGTDALAVDLDNTIGATEAGKVRATLMRDGILYGRILLQDSICFTNPGVRQVVGSHPDGIEFLRNGILVPLRRSSLGSFAESLDQARAKKMAGIDDTVTKAYADLLEVESGGGGVFDMAAVSRSYTDTLALTRNPDVLESFGIRRATAEAYVALLQDPRSKDNTFIWDTIMPQFPLERDLLWQCARGPYVVSVPSALGIGMACPANFSGDKLLAALATQSREVPSLSVADAGRMVGKFALQISDAVINWLFGEDTLARMTATDLASARAVSSRTAYLIKLEQHFALGDEPSWRALEPSLEAYLRDAASEVFRRFIADGRLTIAPTDKDAPVLVTGGGALNVTIPDVAAFHLVGATSRTQAIQIIGRPVSVPILGGSLGQGMGSHAALSSGTSRGSLGSRSRSALDELAMLLSQTAKPVHERRFRRAYPLHASPLSASL